MRRAAIIAILIIAATTGPAAAGSLPDSPGIPVACATQTTGPCKKFIIPETQVPSGETYCYCEAEYVGRGTVVIADGASVIVRNATISFENTSHGFVTRSGGSLTIETSLLKESGDSPYRIVAEAGSHLHMVGASVFGGEGALVQTSDAVIRGDHFEGIPTALTLHGATVTVDSVRFVRNQLALLQVGGQPTLVGSTFEHNHECVHDFQTDPTIVGNVFLHCIIGIWHEQSHSLIADNFMEEDGDPGSIAMVIKDGNSPTVARNVITDFAVGIQVVNARAFLEDNDIHGNGVGILVERNSMPMHVTNNSVHDNFGDGIRLVDAVDVRVADNHVFANGGDGIDLQGGLVQLARNRAEGNGGHGIVLRDAASVTLEGDAAADNAGDGIRIERIIAFSASRLEALRNQNGFSVLETQATISRANASDNREDGFHVDAGTVLATVRLDCVRALGNLAVGVENIAGVDSARFGWYQGNGIGVSSEAVEAVVDATDSYWGSASGPTTVTNPDGGDRVQGKVLFVPFATQPPACG